MKPQYQVMSLALGAVFAALGGNARAGADEQVLDVVVVSGSRAASWLSETPQAIGVVKQKELRRDKPKTMGEIINRIAGVYWNDLGNEQHSMAIRQPIGTNAVYQYLEDGIPIRPLGVFNHNSLNEMNMAGTESVEVVKGPASSLYGSNAVGGAVNFLTSAASPTPYASVGVRRDNTAGFTRYDTSASNTWGALGLRFSHYSSRRSRDNWQEYSYGDKDSFSLRADYALGAASQLRATLVHTDLDAAMPGGLFENDFRATPGKSLNTFSYRKDKTTRANLAWEGETTRNGSTTVTLFSRKNDHGQIPSYSIGSCVGIVCKGVINNNHVDSLGVDVKHQQGFDWLGSRLIAGIYVDRSDNPYVSDNLNIVRDPASGKYLRYTLATAGDPGGLRGVRDYQTDISNTAVFAQWEFAPLAKARVVVGGRSDAIRYNYHNRLAPGGSDNFGAPNESRSFSHFSPKIGATYALGKQASIYTNISEGFTPPEVSQLYGKTGIADLQPATYNNYEMGLRMALLDGKLKLDAALYRLDGRDTIVSYTVVPGTSENRNAGRTRSQGLELGLHYDAGPFDARFGTAVASHRYVRYQVSGSLDYSGREMPQAPSDITSAEVGYKPLAGARVALEVLHQGRYWMDNANTVKYPGHTLLNLRANYQFAKSWEAWLQVRNLTDKRYADSASSSYSGVGKYVANSQNQYTPGAPRSVMLGLSYTFAAQ
ncbi:TonB-dependent receptor family protein [Janthinobacterium fluminis]|uniref:TonB-dependent receptor n=1 Tax=Janthinobacterium fluminis TaxID=2987524 RepID=A0ABT5JWS1_9BURK|nr:TonB-dependent receptor [Janthinobacterium fluminis]MDC8757194.1 TonB-dependent receptor [Janthinobacterium fluminis]